MKPLKLSPAFANYLWGGERLKTEFKKRTNLTPLAESWEISCHPDGPSIIEGGSYDGMTLAAVIERYGKELLLGRNCMKFEEFPILVKYIDAKTPLSLQVHPSDDYARAKENSFGKTEMWIVLDALPGSFLYFGVNRETTKQELEEAIQSGTLESLLGRREVHKGDVLFIPAGELHAIGAGILVLEVQQNSNITYRVYDYNRRDSAGNLRELHVEKALEVSALTPPAPQPDFGAPKKLSGAVRELLADCPYFTVTRLTVSTAYEGETDGSSFVALCCVEGAGELIAGGERVRLKKGDSFLLPADSGSFFLAGEMELIETVVGE